MESISVVTIDESVIAYQPKKEAKSNAEKKEEPIPMVYIPRKPHPNGLLIYQLATFVQHATKENKKMPFIINMLSHLKMNDTNPTHAFKEFIDRFVI